MTDEDYEILRAYIEDFTGGRVRNRKIKSLRVLMSHKGKSSVMIEVGRYYDGLERGMPTQKVLAIFESDSFLVVTEDRGNMEGPPLYLIRDNVREVVLFGD